MYLLLFHATGCEILFSFHVPYSIFTPVFYLLFTLDRRIPIPDFVPYGVGRIESLSVPQLASSLGAKLGICTTGNALDKHSLDDHHMEQNDASVKDMEMAAIAWAATLHSTPHFGVKVVTDIVDGDKPTQEEFFENLASAAMSLQEALPKVIEYVCGKNHDEL